MMSAAGLLRQLGDLALTARVAIRSAGIADPRILGEPFVRRPTQRTMCAAEEHRGGVEGCAVSPYAGGNGPPCLGAEDQQRIITIPIERLLLLRWCPSGTV